MRADVGFDLQNLFNTNYATAYTTTYAYDSPTVLGDEKGGTWLNPTSI